MGILEFERSKSDQRWGHRLSQFFSFGQSLSSSKVVQKLPARRVSKIAPKLSLQIELFWDF